MGSLVKNYNPFRELEEYKLEYLGVETNENLKWIAINSSRGGILKEPWLRVTNEINEFEDILKILNQIRPIIIRERLENFNLTEDVFKNLHPNLFAYFLGILIGDASKPFDKRKFGVTRRVGLSLSKKYDSNENLGEFVCLCANSLGLRMNRIKDTQKGKRNTHPFYRWASQSSMLIQWVFQVCLGLNDNQLTTYDSINADWIFKTTKDFKIWFIQGLADSDGFVDLQANQVGIITQPNTSLIKLILESLGVKSRKRIFDGRLEGLMISLYDAYRLPVFNPYVRSYRFDLLEKLINAERIRGHWPEWLSDKVDLYLKNGLRGTQIVKKILNEFNIGIRTKQIYKRSKLMEFNGR